MKYKLTLFKILITFLLSVWAATNCMHCKNTTKNRGCKQRVHGSSGETFLNHLSIDDRLCVQNVISNYAEVHAVLLPGSIPGFKRDDIKLLPSSKTKVNVWRRYKLAMGESSILNKPLLFSFPEERLRTHFWYGKNLCLTLSGFIDKWLYVICNSRDNLLCGFFFQKHYTTRSVQKRKRRTMKRTKRKLTNSCVTWKNNLKII